MSGSRPRKLWYFPLIIDAWVNGTRDLTFEEKGFYLDLILWMYDTGKGVKDAQHVARILGCDPRTSRRLLAKLRPKFYERSGEVRHKLVTKILKNNGKINGLLPHENLREPPTELELEKNRNTDTGGDLTLSQQSPEIVSYSNPLGVDARKKPKKAFVRPTVSEVAEYCALRKNQVDPSAFHSYYEANGWKVGRNAMKNWQAAVRTWERNGAKYERLSKFDEQTQRIERKRAERERLERLRELGLDPSEDGEILGSDAGGVRH